MSSSNNILCIKKESFHTHPLIKRLLELSDVPEEIYIKGKLPEIKIDDYGRAYPRILTIVGSRKNSIYGKRVLTMLMNELKNSPIIIISGLATGIDSITHKESLKNNLINIGIPGSGLNDNVFYPKENILLSREIINNGGLLLSPYEPDTKSAKWTFPGRNRIMSALSDATLIIEAEEKSGTLITARISLELGKDIGVIPGDIFSPNTKGSNKLIKEGAYPILEKNDIYELLHLPIEDKENSKKITDLILNKNEKIIFDLTKDTMNKDELLNRSKLSYEDFILAFSSLEINGYVDETLGEVRRLV